MEYYDVIIIGAGIAGCSLAYNLKRIGYKGKVLVIDKKEIGANAGYGYRVMLKKDIEEYGIPHVKKFKGIKIGSYKNISATIDKEDYFVIYQEVCKHLLNNSDALFNDTEASLINKDILLTNDKNFKFKYIIDCSGASFFSRKLRKEPLPIRSWVGLARIVEGDIKNIDRDYYYYIFGDGCSFEDFYVVGNKIIHGYWQYVKKIDYNLIEIPENEFFKNHVDNFKIISEKKKVIPNAPIFPIVCGNMALLGDSFGNAFTSSAIGLVPILDSSKILARAIKQENLKQYQKKWKKKYLKSYLSFLVSRIDRYDNSSILKSFKKKYPTNEVLLRQMASVPEEYVKLLNNDDSMDSSIAFRGFPIYRKLFLMYHYFMLKLKYLL
ncbi:MAG: FAD-dependent oxidoreductase [Nanoarchaeota archaeon]|nr:FAD-dependent oxidoreductase [Nanoarchaeota archaeon]